MIPKLAIEKALEGGWQKPHIIPHSVSDIDKATILEALMYSEHVFSPTIALDPTFWQALGNALEWEEDWYIGHSQNRDKVEGKLWRIGCTGYYRTKFYDLILIGGDTEKFWAELLSDVAR